RRNAGKRCSAEALPELPQQPEDALQEPAFRSLVDRPAFAYGDGRPFGARIPISGAYRRFRTGMARTHGFLQAPENAPHRTSESTDRSYSRSLWHVPQIHRPTLLYGAQGVRRYDVRK